MPKRVIDGLEAIKVNEKYSQRLAVSLTSTDRLFELLSKKPSIRQRGQIIILRSFFQFDRASHNVGDVAECDDSTDECATAVIQSLTVDAQDRVGLVSEPVYGNLVGKFFSAARFDQRQFVMVDGAVTVSADTAE